MRQRNTQWETYTETETHTHWEIERHPHWDRETHMDKVLKHVL